MRVNAVETVFVVRRSLPIKASHGRSVGLALLRQQSMTVIAQSAVIMKMIVTDRRELLFTLVSARFSIRNAVIQKAAHL